MTDRYTVSIQLIKNNNELQRRNFYVYAESEDDAVVWLDIQMKIAWDSMRLDLVSAEKKHP